MGLDLNKLFVVTTPDLRLLIFFVRMKLGKFAAPNDNSRISKLAIYALLAFIAFSLADLTIIYFRDAMIPDQAPPKKIAQPKPQVFLDKSQFSIITNRNLFSSSGIIPDPLNASKSRPGKKDNEPVPSKLPITVIGTLVHSNPAKSIVALEVKSKNLSGSFSTGADIEGMATIERIERNMVFIRNSSSGVLEYLELSKAGNKVAFGASKPDATKPGKEVQSVGNNTFAIKRSDLLKYTNDLSSVLMQARAVPNRDPNTGEINGFRVLDMQPGSIYEQLGLQRMDVIKGVNGEPVDSVQKAMEMYNTLKNGNQVKMQIERSGKTETFIYDVK